MNATHTPEPWSWKAGSGKISIVAPHQPASHLRGQYTIAYTSTRNDKEANASRIVACVNACSGIPTWLLEDSASLDHPAHPWTILRQLNTELAAALRELVELKDLKDRDVAFDGDAYQDYAKRKPLAWETARAVLSKVSA